MQQAKNGDTVRVHYKGSLDDGSVFDSSEEGDPIEFTIGSGEVIPGFEEAIIGMSPGDTKTEVIDPENAYGGRMNDLVFSVPREQLGATADDLEVGDVVRVGFSDGRSAPVQVSEIGDQSVTLDANHPLAGKRLTFDLTLVGIN